MSCFTPVLAVLGIPLLAIYFLQPKKDKNGLWLVLGIVFEVVAVIVVFIK